MNTIHIIAGPTASGKSALALEHAMEMDGEIINADSRQIYDCLPILSAQPSDDEKKLVPHHLYGTLHPNESCSAGLWLGLVRDKITDTLARGKTPFVVGGTGLYLKALMEGLSPIPQVPDDIRAAANALCAEIGPVALHQRLSDRDPETAALYHPNHTARIIHAWEILEMTGKGLAHWQSLPKNAPPVDWRFEVTLVMPDRQTLYDRCDRRFEAMLENGAMEEAEAFDNAIATGTISKDAIVTKTIGLAPLRALRLGAISKEEATSLAQTETRQYAKRQMTWFRNQLETKL